MSTEELLDKVKIFPSNFNYDTYKMYSWYIPSLPGGNYVDFGTCWGRSATAASLLNDQLTVFTFDNGENGMHDYEQRVKEFLSNFPGLNINFSVEDSRTKEWDKPIVGLSIDSSHSYENTKAEIEKWVPYLVVGGIVFLDDYLVPQCGVKRAVDEYFESNSDFDNLNRGGMCAVFRRIK